MIRKTIVLAVMCHCLALTSLVFADTPDKSPKTLSELATTIVIGRIIDLEIEEESGQHGFTDLALYYTIEVSSVEKGQIQSGDRIVVRAWKWKERKRPYVGNNGHSPLPAVGETVRVFLRGKNVEHPNGFAPAVPLDTVSDQRFFDIQRNIKTTDQFQELLVDGSDRTPRETRSIWWIAGIIGLVVIGSVGFFTIRSRRLA